MRILGLKLTHDAAVALLDDGRLSFSVELEKLDNNPRHTACSSLGQVERVLELYGVDPDSIDSIVIDGWKGGRIERPAPFHVAPYHDFDIEHAPLFRRREFAGFPLFGRSRRYASYTHVAGHIASAWATSPLAAAAPREPFYALTWDGGQQPRLHYVDPANGTRDFVRSLHELYGIVYGIMGYYFGPFARPGIENVDVVKEGPLFGGYETPGKLMAYVARGTPNEHVMLALLRTNRPIEEAAARRSILSRYAYEQNGVAEHALCRSALAAAREHDVSDEDALATIHAFLEWLLVKRATEWTHAGSHLVFAGGSALNIKWNSALRNSGHFASVWVPPMPNDSGSALGAAVAEHFYFDGWRPIEWDVYAGPQIHTPKKLRGGWTVRDCSPEGVGELLAADPGAPIVFLWGAAEIGPRALGHRSLLAHPGSAEMKDRLNRLKKREMWRPVAPICLEEEAPRIFSPGTPDPYMLFDHVVRAEWRERIPAILHLDNTARLQTISERQCPIVTRVLREFHRRTGIPLLCNTSANLSGSGFFPDFETAAAWCEERGIGRIWINGKLYEMEVSA